MDYYGTEADIARLEAALAGGGPDRCHRLATLAWYLREDDPPRALRLAEDACVEVAPDAPPALVQRLQARAALVRAAAAEDSGNDESAAALEAKALAIFEDLQDIEGRIDAHLVARIRVRARSGTQATEHLAAALELCEQAGEHRRWYVRLLSGTGDTGAARRWLEASAGVPACRHPAVAMVGERAAFRVALSRSDGAGELAHQRNAYEQAVACRAMRQAVENAGAVSTACLKYHDLESALEWSQRAIDVARPRGMQTQLCSALSTMGAALRALGRLQEAWAIFEESVRIWPAHSRGSRPWAVDRVRAGETALDMGLYEASLACLRAAREAASAHYSGKIVATTALCLQIQPLSELDRLDEALQAAQQALQELTDSDEHAEYRAGIMAALASVARRHGLPLPPGSTAPSASLHYLEQALEYGQRHQVGAGLVEWLSEASREYERVGDPARALALERRAVDLRNELMGQKATDLATALRVRHETERARAEAEHHSALAAAEARRADAEAEANRAKGAFLANMSHELRSPLNAMLGFSRLLLRDPELHERARRDVAIVLRSGEHLHALINQVLEMSKIEAGGLTLQPVACDVRTLVEQLRELYALAAGDKGLALVLEIDPRVPREVQLDAPKLRQVLANLVGNAIKFTERGRVALRVERVGPGRLGFVVDDTGVGIAPQELATLGHAFVQAQAGQRAAEGTGLGLAISRGLVRLMGGSLELRSQPGQGTSVSFVVDVGEAATAPVSPAPSGRVQVAPGAPAPRILVADDHPEDRELLARTLAPLGFEVRQVADGQQAIDEWQRWGPRLICMDMRMPVMDGREATRRIKATAEGAKTVIVALTASSFEEQREEILAVGCDDFLRKPFEEAALMQMLARHLQLPFEPGASGEAPGSAPDPSALSGLPAPLLARLRDALTGLDVQDVELAMAELRHHDAQAADLLAPLVERFEYERVLRMLGPG